MVAVSAAAGASPLRLSSSAFAAGEPIPARFTCRGANVSPPLRWSAPPSGTRSFAIEVEDPDAPLPGGFTHWLGWGIAPDARALAVGQAAPVSGANGTGAAGYTGPCPPGGTHHYHFTLYALSARTLPLRPGSSRPAFLAALKGRVVAKGELVGTFAAG